MKLKQKNRLLGHDTYFRNPSSFHPPPSNLKFNQILPCGQNNKFTSSLARAGLSFVKLASGSVRAKPSAIDPYTFLQKHPIHHPPDHKIDKQPDDVIGSGNKGSGGKCRVNFELIKYKGNKSAEY